MEREIKFRGKRIANNEWVFGNLIDEQSNGIKIQNISTKINKDPNQENGVGTYQYAVFPNTVGQFTGLRDKNSKEIYEGDIWEIERVSGVNRYVWKWHKKFSRFVLSFDGGFCATVMDEVASRGEIIGNIFDNPELLKEV